MRTRPEIEQEILDTLADEHRCAQADDDTGIAVCCQRLEDLEAEWVASRLPQQRPATG